MIVPVVAAILAGTFTSIRYVLNLTDTIEANKQTLINLERDLEVAKETGLPLFLHQRDAHEDFINCLNEIFNEPIKGVAHCFTGNAEQMKTYLDMGLYIGITGWICDERRNQELIRAVKQLPLNRVLIETDSPYLIPRSLKKSRRNEPMHLPIVAMKLADEMNIEASRLVNHARENSIELFGLSG